MRKIIAVLLLLTLACFGPAGCAGQNDGADGRQLGAAPGAPANTADTAGKKDGGLTLAEIRKAAKEAGYNVSDGHNLVFMKEVKDGFSVRIVADGQDVIYSVIECKTEDAAVKNAKDIDDAGYNIAIRSGKILTCYGVDKKDGTVKDILASIVAGRPTAVK
ncbi:MAG: hypothetical protein HPY50_21400 [Firmicutes bacterium]|nr:hypothetical protein [Bacillota bacterium]